MSGNGFDALFASWEQDQQAPQSDGDTLPSHHPQCLGCGVQNPHGHHLEARREGATAVVATHKFDARHVGAPGIAHGGAVATVLDDLYGFLLYAIGNLAVTRKLEVEYLRPVLLDVEYSLRAVSTKPDGRKIRMSATLEDVAGQVIARSVALFLIVEIEHFTSHGMSDTAL